MTAASPSDAALIDDDQALAAELDRLARRTSLARARADLALEEARTSAIRALQRAFDEGEAEDSMRKAANDFLKHERPTQAATPAPAPAAPPPHMPHKKPGKSATNAPHTPPPPHPAPAPDLPTDPDAANKLLEHFFHTNTKRPNTTPP